MRKCSECVTTTNLSGCTAHGVRSVRRWSECSQVVGVRKVFAGGRSVRRWSECSQVVGVWKVFAGGRSVRRWSECSQVVGQVEGKAIKGKVAAARSPFTSSKLLQAPLTRYIASIMWTTSNGHLALNNSSSLHVEKFEAKGKKSKIPPTVTSFPSFSVDSNTSLPSSSSSSSSTVNKMSSEEDFIERVQENRLQRFNDGTAVEEYFTLNFWIGALLIIGGIQYIATPFNIKCV